MSSLLKACKNRTVTRSLIFLTERKIAIKKPPEGDPQRIPFRRFYPVHKGLQDVIRNINIFRDVAELISHIALVDGDVLIFEVRRIEGEIF